jgi:hypothetical protein
MERGGAIAYLKKVYIGKFKREKYFLLIITLRNICCVIKMTLSIYIDEYSVNYFYSIHAKTFGKK